MQIVDPKLASYGVENPLYAVIQLAQTTMRSELGKITLDKTFEERDTLNEKIVVRFLLKFSFILPDFPYSLLNSLTNCIITLNVYSYRVMWLYLTYYLLWTT